MIQEKTLAPDFTLADAWGNSVTLSSLRGKKVLVYFYPKDDTPGCTKEACSLRDGHSQLMAKNTVILGISPDSSASHQKFIEKYGLPFTLLSDPDHTVMEAWGAWGEKNLYGKKSVGVLRTTFVLDEQGVVTKVIKKVDTENHTVQVLPFLG
ncbi:MAG: thioredoxin-dependent thiol peroxidase [Spirochaetales bacterium]|nr:thioredoxin-dependent thiol peroxidase [Spirochaetales bacterium]